MTTPNHTPTPFNGPLVVQELGSRPGYPAWTQFAIRDQKTNVHIATVGHVDRYFEGKAESHAEFIVRAVNAHEAMIEALAGLLENIPQPKDVRKDFSLMVYMEAARKALRAAKGE